MRILLRIIAAGALSFLSTVMVSWWSAYFRVCPFDRFAIPALAYGPVLNDSALPRIGCISRYDTHTASYVSAAAPFSIFNCGRDAVERHTPPPGPANNEYWKAYVPRWALADVTATVRASPQATTAVVAFEAHGWPRPAWYFESHRTRTFNGHAIDVSRGWNVAHPRNAEIAGWRGYGAVLPYGPIWSGIALNASLVAGPLLAMTSFPLIRRSWRRRRGRCETCNYDLAGSVGPLCPECGHELGHQSSTLAADPGTPNQTMHEESNPYAISGDSHSGLYPTEPVGSPRRR
jgi:hypothetical protein